MKFGEKIKSRRKELGLSQTELSKRSGISLRTLQNYENEVTYPRMTEAYEKLATALDMELDALMGGNEEFIIKASDQFGYTGKRQASQLVNEASSLFAGGDISEDDKDALMQALQQAYWIAKNDNKKYASKRKKDDSQA